MDTSITILKTSGVLYVYRTVSKYRDTGGTIRYFGNNIYLMVENDIRLCIGA